MNTQTATWIAVIGSIIIALLAGFLEGAAFWISAAIIVVIEIAVILGVGRRT